jgi:hypothetical protein
LKFIEKLGAPDYAFHDRDVAPEGKDLAVTNKNFDAVADPEAGAETNRHQTAVGERPKNRPFLCGFDALSCELMRNASFGFEPRRSRHLSSYCRITPG